MLYLESPSDVFVLWRGEPLNGIVYPLSIESLWSEQELADVGLYAPVDPGVPDGKVVTGFTVKRVGGVVTKVYDLEDEPPPAPLHITPKDLIWRRTSDEEAEAMELALASQPIRLRRIYEGATYIDNRDELYSMLLSALTTLFGEPRALELLEPTE